MLEPLELEYSKMRVDSILEGLNLHMRARLVHIEQALDIEFHETSMELILENWEPVANTNRLIESTPAFRCVRSRQKQNL